MYITGASTISYQPSFRNPGFAKQLIPLGAESGLMTPDYSEFIPPMERRRMSDVIRMAIACSLDCLEQTGLEQPDGIIVGTSMGCPLNTRHFLEKIVEAGSGPLSPTSFIVSTHNSIAGQVAMRLKNHGYNMTHTQNSLSFEQALTDAMLCIGEGSDHILVGGTDEQEDILYNMRERLGDHRLQLTCGASFFVLSRNGVPGAVRLTDAASFGLTEDPVSRIHDFLAANNLPGGEPGLVLFCTLNEGTKEALKKIFGQEKLMDYLPLAGTWFTNPAFAMHLAIDLLQFPPAGRANPVQHILVCNNLIPENLGLLLLSREPS